MAIDVRADLNAEKTKKKKIDVRADIARTAAPKISTNKQDKSYTGVDAEINRREASRSARYSMQPEVRAAEIKRAEARGDTKRASELKKATDIEQWAKEQVNSDFVRSRAQTVYDNEFNAAKLRGDQSPAVAAEHAAQGYLDLFRNKPQETRNETYAYRQDEKRAEIANVLNSNDFGRISESGKVIGANLGGKLPKNEYEKIMAFVNNEPYRDSIEALAVMNHGDSNLAKQIRQFTEDEKNIIRYYAALGEKDKVEEFYKLMERELNRRIQTKENEKTRQEAYDKPILGAAKNVMADFAAPGAYVANAANVIANKFRDDYIPTDTNSPAFRGAHMVRETSSGVTERARDAAGGGTAGEIASLAAGTGLSIANNLTKLPLGGTGTLLAMGLSGAGQTTLDVLERGGTEGQALLLGTAAGAIEAMTEKIPLDNLFKIAGEIGEKGFKKFIKTLVKNSPKQGITEMGEEAISEIANTILDIAVMKEKSGYEQYIAELMKDGMTRPEAEKEALINYVGANTLKAGAGGFLSGLVMGGGATAVSKVNTAIESRNAGARAGNEFREGNMTAEDMQEIIAEGLSANPESSSYKLAAKLQQKLDRGEPVSWTEYGKLYNENVRNVDAEAKVEATDGAGAEKITPGFTKNEYSYDVSNKTIRALDAIGKKLGVEIEIGAPTGNTVDAYNGKYENGKITIARDSENPLEVVLSHEVTHHMQQTAPAEYAKFVELAVNASTKLSDVDKAELINRYKAEYSEGTETAFSEQEAIDEITADYASKLVRDTELFRNLVNNDRNVARRFVDGVKRFISKVKSTFSKDKSKADTASLEKYGLTVSELEKAVKTYDAMVKATKTAVGTSAITENLESANAEMVESADADTEETTPKTDEFGNTVTTEVDEEGNARKTIEDTSGETVAQINNNGTASFSLKTYRQSGRKELNNWLNNEVAEGKITEQESDEITTQLEELYNICTEFEDKYAVFGKWSEAEVVTDSDGNPLMSVIKANGDYNMNLDFSLVCKKRRTLDAVFKAMAESGFMDEVGELSEKQIATINNIIRTYGLETACTLCFVDSKRYRASKVASSFVEKYNSLVKMLAPKGTKIDIFDFKTEEISDSGLHTMSDEELVEGIKKLKGVIAKERAKTVKGRIAQNLIDNPQDRRLVLGSQFMDSDAFMNLSKTNPRVYTLYNSSKGSGGPKASLPDVQYLGDILKKSSFTPEKAYAVGGVRIQSFSDYIPRLVFDYLQMTADLAAKKLPAHAYTKEEMFVLQFGKTGIKINLSLVPAIAEDGIAPGLDSNGNYIWKDGHSFGSDTKKPGSGNRGYQLAVQIQNADGYSENVGTIAVGVSDKHIEKLLLDKNIRMVIPYHKSSLNKVVAQMGNIHKYEDYTNEQSTRKWSSKKGKWLKFANKVFDGENLTEFDFNEAFHRLGDAKAAVKEYLAWCDENGYKPKFDRFAFHENPEIRENYYKLLIDFAAYDQNGNATPQREVRMNFPTSGDAFGSMKDLIESGLEEDAVLEGEREAKLPEILDEVKNTIKAKKSIKRGDLLSKDYKAPERAKYSLKKTSEKSSAEETPKSESDEEAFRKAFGDWAYDPEEESSYFDETGLADDAAQNPKEDYSNIDSLYADLAKRENIIAEEADEREQELIDKAYQNAIAEPATEKKTLSEKVSESGNFLKRKIVNSGAAIRDIAKVTKDKFLYPIYNRARGSMNIAEDMLTNKQTNIRGEKVGEGLESIILPIKNKGKEYFREFQLYMLNKHNVARMSLENAEATARAKAELDKFLADNPQIAKLAALGEDAIQNAAKWDDARGFRAKQYLELRNEWQKLLRTKNKPIFFDREETPLSADISRTKAEELIKKHPEFAEHEAKVRKYLDNLMQYRVDSGLITQEEADYFRKKYPDYVPTYRNKESVLQELYGKKNIGKTLGIARGGVEKLLPLDIALAEMTKKVVKNGQKNMFTNKLFDIFEKNSKLLEEYITDANEGIRELDAQIDEFGEDDPKFKNTVGFYKDGKYIELTMTPKLYEAFAEMSKAPEEKAPVADWWRILNNGYKKLITTYDPTFIIRNGLKDLQDATINSKDTKALMKNLPKAYVEIANGGELFELYKSMGGLHSSRFDEIKTKGVEKKSWAKKIPDALAFGNMMVEQAPRLAEFMSVLEKGDRNDPNVLADALYAAADITTNFGESGTWGKLLNAYYVPFLNPAIQGTAKIGRLITEPKTAKQWYGLAAKAVIMGVGAGFINDIIIGIFGDEEEKEEYEKLQDRVKDNYFLIPTDDGKFAKIPKGRIAASLGVVADRVRDVVKGEKVSAGEAVARILENIAPENPITNNILSPFINADLFNNESKGKTWYGGDIESDSLQGLPAGERFDSSTDYISKYVGKALGLSPKKINYILKQYTGGAGRTILPMLTPSEQKGDTIAGKIGYGALSILASNFMVDSKLSNKVSGEFYDAVSEAEQKKNSSKGTLADKVVYKHLNRERNQMSGYNKKIREAETDSSLTSKEKDVAVRTATASRSEYQKDVLDNLDKYRANVEKYLKEYPGKDEEKKIEYAYRKANYATYGAEYALRVSGGKSVYDKALEKVNRGKTTWKEYYEEYFGKDERRYEKLREKYDISYAEYEAIAQAMSKNSTEEEEIEALHKLGYKRSTARGIRRNFNKVK